MSKKGVIAAVVGIGALGLGAVALMRSGDTTQKKDADSMFSGMLGGGATGGYSDTTGVVPPSNSVSDTIGGILNDVLQTQPQTQTPVFFTPPNSGFDDLLPLIDALDNPSDETADIKQGEYNNELARYAFQNYSGAQLLTALDNLGFTTTPKEPGVSNAAYTLMSSLNTTTNPQSNTGVEYSPFSFTPTPKQQDISSYNVGKTGGATANTPAKNTNTGQAVPAAKKETSTPSNSMNITSTPSTLGGAVISAVGRGVTTAVDTIGSFVGGLFGGN
jgi:hypothetical protein